MLIIAIPKSASTSLLKTIGKLHLVEAEQKFALPGKVPDDYRSLANFHTDVRELDDGLIKVFSDKSKIYKQHIPPTPNNLQKLEDISKVVLLREPVDILKSYFRSYQKGLSKNKGVFAGFNNEDEWLAHAEKSGLADELNRFYRGWEEQCGEKTLPVYYRDLMEDPGSVIKRIEQFLGLKVSTGNIHLAKSRYSRTNKTSGLMLYTFQDMKAAVFEILKKTGLYPMLLKVARKLRN